MFLSSDYSQKVLVVQPGPVQGKDAYINSAYPDDQEGDNQGLIACAWTFDGEFGIGRSLISFDLSQIPIGAQVLDARLTLFFDPEVAFGSQYGENASYLEKITEDWNEMTVTWSTQPPSSGTGGVFIGQTQSSSQNLADIDITGFVSEWVLHPETNFGIMHRMAVENTYCCVVYSSSDKPISSMRPKLVITYLDCDPPVAGFSYTTLIPVVNFTDTSNSAYSWFWDFGDGYFSDLQNPQHEYTIQGIYTVCLIVNDSCGSDTACKEIPVCEMPEPHFYYTANTQMVTFQDSSTLPQSWFWDFGDGFYSYLQDPEHYFNEPGTYYVCEKVTNACNVQTFCDSVTVVADALEDLSKTFRVEIYPNPSHDMVFLQLNVQTRSTVIIELFTPQSGSLMKWVREVTPADVSVSLNIAGLARGIYFLQTKIDGIKRLNKLIIL